LIVFTLYHAPHTCSLASHIALEDAGAAYELQRIDFGKAEQKVAKLRRDQSESEGPGAEDAARNPGRDTCDTRLYRAEFSRGAASAAG
jgi:hypothetical protein